MVVPVFLGMTEHNSIHVHFRTTDAGVAFLATTVHAVSYHNSDRLDCIIGIREVWCEPLAEGLD